MERDRQAYKTQDGVPSWTKNKSDSYRAVMDNFQQYDNTAGFFVGNEVLNSSKRLVPLRRTLADR